MGAPQPVVWDAETPQHEAVSGHLGEQPGIGTTGERIGH